MTDIPPFTHFVQELRMFTSEYVGRNKELSLRNVTAQLFSVLFYFFVIKKKKKDRWINRQMSLEGLTGQLSDVLEQLEQQINSEVGHVEAFLVFYEGR